ncbi:RICIN domain-containing protein [Neptunitalea lumnitzerae]|nr:RICIN domain-containing protein [Neptunitalea sp. Y10]
MTAFKYLFFGILTLQIIGCNEDSINDIEVDANLPEQMEATNPIAENTSNVKGVNWADARDNFVDTWLVLSGLNVSDDLADVTSKTEIIISSLQDKGINMVRLPVNPATVLQNWWPQHSTTISTSAALGMNVIIAYWEGDSSKDGKVDNLTSFYSMWDTLITKYVGNENVYFEIMNEPHGYSEEELKTIYADWIAHYPDVPLNRIVLDGVGYATGVNEIGSDSRFSNCLLSFHYYTWFNNSYQTTADWELPIKNLQFPERTIMTEFGVPMTTGKDYSTPPNNDVEINYLQGITSMLQEMEIGSIYWPGIRTNDSYSMFTYTNNQLLNTNETGLDRLYVAWNMLAMPHYYPSFNANTHFKITNRNSGKVIDVNGGSTTNGGSIIQWDYSGGDNQLWSFTIDQNNSFTISNKNSNKVLDVNNASTEAGAGIIQWESSQSDNQKWIVENIGFGYSKIINKNSGLSLDVNGGATNNGGDIIQWYWNNGQNQQWEISSP